MKLKMSEIFISTNMLLKIRMYTKFHYYTRLLFSKVENEFLDLKFFTVLLKFVTEVKEEVSTL